MPKSDLEAFRDALTKIAMENPNIYWKADDLHAQLARVIFEARTALTGSRKPLVVKDGAKKWSI